jgi:hypothetical protein
MHHIEKRIKTNAPIKCCPILAWQRAGQLVSSQQLQAAGRAGAVTERRNDVNKIEYFIHTKKKKKKNSSAQVIE